MPESHNPAAPFSVRPARRVLKIDEVDDIAGTIDVRGREVDVHHLDGAAYRELSVLQAGGGVDILAMYDIVERICPDLPRVEIDTLTAKQVGMILAVAEHGIKDVEAQAPNADGATETNDQPPPSSPATSSATSSPALP